MSKWRLRLPRVGRQSKWSEQDQREWDKQVTHGEQMRRAVEFAGKADKATALRSLRFAHEFERAWEQRTKLATEEYWRLFRLELAKKAADPEALDYAA